MPTQLLGSASEEVQMPGCCGRCSLLRTLHSAHAKVLKVWEGGPGAAFRQEGTETCDGHHAIDLRAAQQGAGAIFSRGSLCARTTCATST